MQENKLDQFYTKDDLALDLCVLIKHKLGAKISDYTFLEPSAGCGAFVKGIKASFTNANIIALDIDPKEQSIQKGDFLAYAPNTQKIFTIGNPPFGKRASLAINFFNHASNFSDYIAFIVPLQFEKWSVQSKLNKDFKLIYSQKLEPKSFIFQGKECEVRCAFQIWTRLESSIDLRLKEPPPTTHKDFEMWQYNNTPEARKYFDKQKYKWDFAVARQGFYDYKKLILKESELNPKRQYIFFKANDRVTLNNLKSLDFERLSHKNTTIPGFGKADVVSEYKRICNE